jgi:hypothetical protein
MTWGEPHKAVRGHQLRDCAPDQESHSRAQVPTALDTRHRELAHRSNNGVNVTLSWDTETDELLVCVDDERRNVYFELQPARDLALDVYYHPYAHAGYDDDALAS